MGFYVLNNDRVIQTSNGRIIVPVSQHSQANNEWSLYGRIMIYLSDDNGFTWERSESILESSVIEDKMLQEPGVIELQDSRLLMFMRTNLEKQYFSYSNDLGKTWSSPNPSNINSPLSPASIERIPSTGDLLLIWNNNSINNLRTPFNVAISNDEGTSWINYKTIENNMDGWYCYTAIEFINDRIILGHISSIDGNLLGTTQITSFTTSWLYNIN